MKETVLQEADRLVSSDRQDYYGHPFDNYTILSKYLTIFLSSRGLLKDGAELTPSDSAMMNLFIKIARESHRHKRDNLVDIGGYAKVIDMIHQKIDETAEQEPSGKSPDTKESPRVVSIDVGDMPPDQAVTYFEQTKAALKRNKNFNPPA